MTIETKIKYSGKIWFDYTRLGHEMEGFVFKREDYHEDGSVSEYYGIEIGKEDYAKILRFHDKVE